MGWLSKIFGGGSPAPPPPDFNAAAEKTAQSAQQAQTAADYANRGTITDPWGTQTSTPRLVTDPATGKSFTTYDTSYTLNPQQQQALDAQMAIDTGKSQFAQQLLGQAGAATANPMDYSKFQAYGMAPEAGNLDANQYMTGGAGQGIMAGLNTASLGAMPQADAAERQRIEDMLYQRQQPAREQAQQRLETQLVNQGYQRGTPQFNDAMQQLQRSQADERYNAMMTGGQEMERLFNMGMQGRQQGWTELLGSGEFQNQAQQQAFNQMMGQNEQNFGMQQQAGAQNYNQQLQSAGFQNALRQQQIAEEMQRRSQPLNELNALLSGTQVDRPNIQQYANSTSAGGADYNSAAKSTYNAQKDAAAAQAARSQGIMGGLGKLAGTAMKMYTGGIFG